MLQQTRVETVVDYWQRFLAELPDVGALAAADIDDVLALWSGLGYYRRARSLHAAAQRVVADHGGRFPRTRAELLSLPGVGPYTAGAVLSIAFDLPEALVDGNVERVFARLFELDAPLDDPAFKKHAWRLAELFVGDAGSPRTWNQAVMELGATVCTPRAPRCEECPVARSCRARRAGRAAELPRPKARRATVPVELEILVVRERGRWLVQRRPEAGRMAGLAELPTRESGVGGAAPSGLFPSSWPTGGDGSALVEPLPGPEPTLGEIRHGITHHRIRARLVAGRRVGRGRLDSRFFWVSADEQGSRALTGMARKVLRHIRSSPSE